MTAIPYRLRLSPLLLGFTILLATAASAAHPIKGDKTEENNTVFFRVTHPDQPEPSYLFGTMHLMKSGYLDKWSRVQKAFQESDRVVVETVIDSSKLMQIGQMGIMRNTAYEELYDSATLDTVTRYLKQRLSMPTTTLKRMKPVQLAVLTAQKAYQQVSSPLKSAKGISVDQHFATKGQKLGKTLITLETMMEQAEMLFNELSNEKQAEMLIQQIRKGDKLTTFTEKLLERYENRNLSGLHELYQNQDFATQDIGFLVEERNRDWIADLKEPIKKGNTFTAVGALHLPGEEGLLNLLKEKGFEVQPVPVK